jgi:hypothetical protein
MAGTVISAGEDCTMFVSNSGICSPTPVDVQHGWPSSNTTSCDTKTH